MPFNPNLPANGSPKSSAEMRAQLNGLKALIDAILSVNAAQVDATNTLPPGNAASVSVSVTGNTLHFTFNIPAGNDGAQGPPGEVTTSDLNSAISSVMSQTSNNSNGVSTLGQGADPSYQQWQMQQVFDKLDELINALRR